MNPRIRFNLDDTPIYTNTLNTKDNHNGIRNCRNTKLCEKSMHNMTPRSRTTCMMRHSVPAKSFSTIQQNGPVLPYELVVNGNIVNTSGTPCHIQIDKQTNRERITVMITLNWHIPSKGHDTISCWPQSRELAEASATSAPDTACERLPQSRISLMNTAGQINRHTGRHEELSTDQHREGAVVAVASAGAGAGCGVWRGSGTYWRD